MVTKQFSSLNVSKLCLILAKIHMVTKHKMDKVFNEESLILAKIHMVTKLIDFFNF